MREQKPTRYELIDKDGLCVSLHYTAFDALQEGCRRWTDEASGDGAEIPGWHVRIEDSDVVRQRDPRGPVKI